jgi:3-deoxy-D-manno-oct-2-ulosonic acid (Kdo) hydroxylase
MAEVIDARIGDDPDRLTQVLEDGGLVLLRDTPFEIRAEEVPLIDPAIFSGSAKNVSYAPDTGKLGGAGLEGDAHERCRLMLARYAGFARSLLQKVAPGYLRTAEQKRTSFRPGEVAVRALSPRKDDRRLHVDAFPANPNQGRRILRVFTNVNPAGTPRRWRLGEQDFEAFAREFLPRVKTGQAPGAAAVMQALKITKGRRTPYDAAMLQLHDLAKLDSGFQVGTPQKEVLLPAGASWLVYTDSVLHAAMAGQHAFEQTFLLPPEGMAAPEKAPIRILERLMNRPLA